MRTQIKKRKVLVPKGRRFDVFYLVPGFSKGLLVFDLPRHPPGRKRKRFHPKKRIPTGGKGGEKWKGVAD